jgi:DNA polymerase-4
MYLVGKKTSELLKNIGILTIGDLANSDVTRVSKILGKNAKVLIDYANGICENPIQIESSLSKSNSCAFTFLEPTNNIDEIESKIKNLTIRVTKMLSKNIMIKIVYISIKLVNMKNICKRFTFSEYIYKFTDIYSKLIFLYEKNFENVKIKTITIGVSNYKRKIFTYKKNTDEECILKKINNNFKRDILIQGNLI